MLYLSGGRRNPSESCRRTPAEGRFDTIMHGGYHAVDLRDDAGSGHVGDRRQLDRSETRRVGLFGTHLDRPSADPAHSLSEGPAGRALQAKWVGQDRQDWVGSGPSVGPDGLQDARIHLSKLGVKVPIKAIRIDGPTGPRWEFGANPQLLSSAELVRDAKDPSQGDLFF